MRATLVIATLSLICALHGANVGAKPIVIGQIASLTGNNPGGRDNAAGAAQAIAEVNSSGGLLGGRPVELLVEDDRTSPAGAAEAFSRLAERSVIAVVGTSYSNASLAVIPLAEAARIPHLSTGAADAQIEPVRSYTFISSMTGRVVAQRLLQYLCEHHLHKLAVVYDADSVFARTGWEKQKDMLPQFNMGLAGEWDVRVNTTDFKSVLDGIAASGADAVMAWLTGPPAVGFVQSYSKAAVKIPLFAPQGMASPAFITAVGASAEGISMAAAPALVASQLPHSEVGRVARAMVQSFEAANGHPPSQFAIDAYVAVKLIAAAITHSKSDHPVAIRDALEKLVLTTPNGEYRYSALDHGGLSPEQIAIVRVHDGRFLLAP